MEYYAANRLVKYNNEDVLYDADGNMTYGPLNGVMTAFTYDCRNRLVSAGNTTYAYDAENNRIFVTVGSTTTSYVVENNSGELSKILSSTTGNKTTLFIYGSGLLAQNDADNGYLYYHFNNRHGQNGAVVLLTSDASSWKRCRLTRNCGILLLLRRVSDTVTDCLPLNVNMTARTRKESRYGNRSLPKKNTAVVMRKRNPFRIISSNSS